MEIVLKILFAVITALGVMRITQNLYIAYAMVRDDFDGSFSIMAFLIVDFFLSVAISIVGLCLGPEIVGFGAFTIFFISYSLFLLSYLGFYLLGMILSYFKSNNRKQ